MITTMPVSSVDRLENWLRMHLAALENPQKQGPLMVYRDRWWALDENGNAMFFKSWTSPQCYTNRQIVERFNANRVAWKCSEVVFVPWAYVRFNISDYC